MVEEGFSYIIECALVNAHLLEKCTEPAIHDPARRGRKKRDF